MQDEHFWLAQPEASRREVLRQGELMMADLLASANASDARSTSLVSSLATLAAALIAGAGAVALAGAHGSLLAAFLISGFGLFLAAGVAAWSALPRDYFASGNMPERIGEAANNSDWLIASSIVSTQRRLERNEMALARSARRMWRAYLIAGIAAAVGVVAYLVR